MSQQRTDIQEIIKTYDNDDMDGYINTPSGDQPLKLEEIFYYITSKPTNIPSLVKCLDQYT